MNITNSWFSPETENSTSLKFPPLFALTVQVPNSPSNGILKLSTLNTPNLSENVSIFLITSPSGSLIITSNNILIAPVLPRIKICYPCLYSSLVV